MREKVCYTCKNGVSGVDSPASVDFCRHMVDVEFFENTADLA